MQARMTHPAVVPPDAVKAIQGLIKASTQNGMAQGTLKLVHLRASQINGCSFCVDHGVRTVRKAGETDERLFAVAACREAPNFTETGRAALAVSESVTRLPDKADAVPDEICNEAANHFSEQELAGLFLWIGTTNLFNRQCRRPPAPGGANQVSPE
jgi:AhpD family alkylhydroperoxidase